MDMGNDGNTENEEERFGLGDWRWETGEWREKKAETETRGLMGK